MGGAEGGAAVVDACFAGLGVLEAQDGMLDTDQPVTRGEFTRYIACFFPLRSDGELFPDVAESDPNSFPSGHTSASFAAATAFFHTLPRRWMGVAAVVMAAVMGLSRLYVGVHFPSDVLCGALVGFLCGLLGWKMVTYIEEKRDGTLC